MELLKFATVLVCYVVVALADSTQKCEQPECPYNQVMEKGACAILVGAVCRVGTDERPCVSGAHCHKSNVCMCNEGNSELLETGRCTIGFGGACNCNSDCEKGIGLSCENSICACPFGSTFNPDYKGDTPATGRCELAAGVKINATDFGGPQCESNIYNSESRCLCMWPKTYNSETMTCDCDSTKSAVYSSTDPLTKKTICQKYTDAQCPLAGFGYICTCPTGATKVDKSKSCVCPGKKAYVDYNDGTCKQGSYFSA